MAAIKLVSVMATAAMLLALLSEAQSLSPAPAPSSDCTCIDQGIAYGLMIGALLLTYLIHPLDAFPYYGRWPSL